ncbi:MAG: hypothetical protein AAFY26_09320 [Cyanobacteria bacterium J06638_22]
MKAYLLASKVKLRVPAKKRLQAMEAALYNGQSAAGERQMTLQEIQNQALQLSVGDR